MSLAPTLQQLGQTEAAMRAFQEAAEIGRKIEFAPLTEYALECLAEIQNETDSFTTS